MNIDRQNKLRELLDRYYDADTTPDEEKKSWKCFPIPVCRTNSCLTAK